MRWMNEPAAVNLKPKPYRDEMDNVTAKAREWRCCHCGSHYLSDEPVAAPIPCGQCGSFFFKVL
jgi:DNA-directed RNA polymerase subunit RPC12/RpoP